MGVSTFVKVLEPPKISPKSLAVNGFGGIALDKKKSESLDFKGLSD
jgi:hypothetical protein